MSLIAIALGVASQVVSAIRENKAAKTANAAKVAANNVGAPAQAVQTQAPSANSKSIQDKIARSAANKAANRQNKNLMYYIGGALVLILGLFFAFKKR